ncbi:uncharacterized protein LOC122385369 [Amphibalanus amphitrite]|uniref:uncharacterized protein LOC122385369 n=1 Tax=Amphibalanus amphitrite TaxID=1232801 RepID=UPI001C91FA44|nr:uncharacterized protein LOC122385369 [Amphibalanus amphitrite]
MANIKLCPCSKDSSTSFRNLTTRWRCQHKTRPRSATADLKPSSKNTTCPARLSLTLKKPAKAGKLSKQKNHLEDGLLGVVSIHFSHNHGLEVADVLKERDVSTATRDRLLELFRMGYSAEQARDELISALQEEAGDDFYRIAADRAHCPDVGYCHRLYRTEFKKVYGELSGEKMLDGLRCLVEQYDGTSGGRAALEVDDHNVVVAIVTPLMRRVSQLWPRAAEMFVDSSGNMDRSDSRLFLLLTHSPVGALPVGAIVTSSESTSVLTAGLQLLLTLMDEQSFGGRGARGPVVAMTDDCAALRAALRNVFPECRLLLCSFHILQAAWRWLCGKQSGVAADQRQEALQRVRALLRATTEHDLSQRWEELLAFTRTKKLGHFEKYMEERWIRRHEWAMCFRSDLMVRGNHTNNLTEAAFRIIKDKLLRRLKVHNTTQLVDIVMIRLENEYSRKVLDAANGRTPASARKRFCPSADGIDKASVEQVGPSTYQVSSFTKSGVSYTVDTDLELCTCRVGATGAPCKHQAAVLQKEPAMADAAINFLPTLSEKQRHLYFQIATGLTAPGGFLASMRQNPREPSRTSQPSTSRSDASAEDQQPDVASEEKAGANLGDGTADLIARCQALCESWQADLMRAPELYGPALNTFISRYERMKTDNSRVSSLHQFGTGCSAVPASSFKSSVMIGVQPTAVARRKVPVGGKRRASTGRPKKDAAAGDHGAYAVPTKVAKQPLCAQVVPSARAPHNLVECVARNVSVGRTHSA